MAGHRISGKICSQLPLAFHPRVQISSKREPFFCLLLTLHLLRGSTNYRMIQVLNMQAVLMFMTPAHSKD